MWIAAIMVFAFLLFTNRSDLNFRGAWKIILAGAIIAAHWVTFFHSIKISTVSVTLATVSTGAFFGSIIEPIIYRRRFNSKELLLGVMVIIGLYLIFRFEGDYIAGILVALLSAFLAAVFQVVNGKLVKAYSAHRITLLEMLGGWLSISIYLLFSGGLDASIFNLQGYDWLWLAILGSVCTAFAFIESVAVMKEISPFTVLLSINLEPVYGILLALFIFGDAEKMDPWFYVGAAIILSSLFLDVYLRRRKRRESGIRQNL
jgi:drug/metabolite transporter (DMT)-like permease